MKLSRLSAARRAAFAVLAAAVISVPVHADETADVNALLQARQFDTALAKTNAFLEKQPKDAQMRFLQGLALTNLGRQAEAINVFTALTRDFPQQAEPYNNLAVLHAGAGDYDSARAALEKAVQADPNYVTAYENLADLYIQMAGKAYTRLAQLEPRNPNVQKWQSVQSKLTVPTTAAAAPSAPPVPVPKSAPIAPDQDKEAVLASLTEWAQAWSARDTAAYLSHYAPEFRTPNREPRAAWEAKRRSLIDNKSSIEVEVISPRVTFKDQNAVVNFRQKYVSDNYSSNERKTISLRRYEDGWKIVEERSDDRR